MTTSLSDILINNYDYFILDQWGVIHNGKNKLPKVNNFINVLKKNNKKIILLSNSSQDKKSMIRDTLIPLNFKINHFEDIISSGEILKLIKNNIIIDPIKDLLNLKDCYVLSNKNDYKNINYLGLNFREIGEAKFVLALSIEANLKMIDIMNIFNNLKDLKIPIICTNPDKYVIDGKTQKKTFQVGFITEKLIKKNLTINYLGKPYSLIYDYLKSKHKLIDNRVIVFGDSLETDIKGANKNNFDSVFLKKAIHKDEKINKKFFKKYKFNKSEEPKFIINSLKELF